MPFVIASSYMFDVDEVNCFTTLRFVVHGSKIAHIFYRLQVQLSMGDRKSIHEFPGHRRKKRVCTFLSLCMYMKLYEITYVSL